MILRHGKLSISISASGSLKALLKKLLRHFAAYAEKKLKKGFPSMGIIDSRSVKTSHHVDSDRGIFISSWN
jgi:hypothetical protein